MNLNDMDHGGGEMGNWAGVSLRPLNSEFCLCCLAEQWTLFRQETSTWQAEKMVSDSRGAGAGSTAPHQLLPEPLTGLCKMKIYLRPALGFIVPRVSSKVLLTGCPWKAGILQGEFLWTEH